MEKNLEALRWGTAQRLEFIEFRLFWEGRFNRSDLIDRFDVSLPQASADLARYQELAPDNIKYDSSEKAFRTTESFKPIIFVPNADRYLVRLKSLAEGIIPTAESNILDYPALDVMPIPHRRVDPHILRKLVASIRNDEGLSVFYHSMNVKRPKPLWRELTAHALAYDGLRWHVRGYCHLENRFKDFVLSRFLKLGKTVPSGATSADDKDWNTFFEVILVPNPKLFPSQRETIALDYGMTNGRLAIRVREALLYYFNKRLRLDVSEQVDNPKETPIIIENKSEFSSALRRAGG